MNSTISPPTTLSSPARPIQTKIEGGTKSVTDMNLTIDKWMTNLPQKLHDIPLNCLILPGSHDSGSFNLQLSSGIAPDKLDLRDKLLVRIFGFIVYPIVRRWTKTQNVNIKQQLESGVRYFDLRAAPKPKSEDLCFVHGLYADTIASLISDMNDFLTKNPQEIAIVDLQHFHEFTDEMHINLVQLLRDTFGSKICSYEDNKDIKQLTLTNLWEKKCQVFIFYRDPVCLSHPFLWPSEALPNPWANTMDTDELCQYLNDNVANRSPEYFYVTQGVLTPDDRYCRRHLISTLYKCLAIPCNKVLLNWMQDKEPGPKGPNIIMFDFVDWNNQAVLKSVIELNYKLVN